MGRPFTTVPRQMRVEDSSDESGSESEELPEQNDLMEAVEKGKRCDSKDVYYVPHDTEPDKYIWVDEKPLQYGLTGDTSKTKKAREAFALNIHRKFNEKTDEWYVQELRINSSLIQSALEKVLEGYPDLTQHSLTSFSPPFLPFFHRWDALIDHTEELDDNTETKKYLELLREVLRPLLKDRFEINREVAKTGHVAFRDLPLVYIPGTRCFHHENNAAGILRSCHLVHPCAGPPYYRIRVDVVDWDGRQCGLLSQDWNVVQYYGLRALTALDVSPFDGLPDEVNIRESLIRRGRIFESLRGHLFMAYTNGHDERCNERMVIDAKAYHKYYENRFPNYAKLTEIGQLTWAQSMNRYSSSTSGGQETKAELSPMSDEQCMLARPTVKCFNIEKKKWEELPVDKIHEIPWAEHAFESLVLDQGEKDLVLALVDREHFKSGKPFDDFIGGKGQGMIMLLNGPPGVGKTLTAETVSEHLRRPLYKLGAGDLGTEARNVEQCLERALKLCAHFGAVLLIDEADVFMEARTSNNLKRNELVSVFLRLLEYYNGIMILTTNRMRSIDSAFESRIDITLTYNSLTEADRRQVWHNFLATMEAGTVDLSEEDIGILAQWDFNGRQIKSAIKTARILAAKKKEPLNVAHLDIVLRLRTKALGLMGGEAQVNGISDANGM